MVGMAFREKLNRELRRRGWSEGQLGRLLGVPRQSVNAWTKRGSLPNLQTGLLLARLLDVSAEYLADDAIEEPPGRDLDHDYLERLVARVGVTEAIRRILAAEPAPVADAFGHPVDTTPTVSASSKSRNRRGA